MKRVENRTVFLLFLLVLLAGWSISALPVQAEGETLNIYALYLNISEKSDCVLLESKGECLLMDIGKANAADAIIAQLNALNIHQVSIYFSHMHADHFGGGKGNLEGIRRLKAGGIQIDRLYMPADDVAPESITYGYKFSQFTRFMEENGGEVIRLRLGSQIVVGDARIDIIGPLEASDVHVGGTVSYVDYENSRSLAAMVTCGTKRFFTAGDCNSYEVRSLLNAYGSSLKADIMKLNHHGTGSGNTPELLQAVAPAYSFASSCGIDKADPVTGKWVTFRAFEQARKYGICFMVGRNYGNTMIYHIENDKIQMYYNSLAPENLLTGWNEISGGNGTQVGTEQIYLDSEGQPFHGVKKLDGVKMYINHGVMDYGSYDSMGNLIPWSYYPEGKRCFRRLTNRSYAKMYTGFRSLDGTKYYFDKKGICLQSKSGTALKKIKKKTYAVTETGEILCDQCVKIKRGKYYLDKYGVLQTSKLLQIKNHYYYFGKNGRMVRGRKEPALVEYQGKTYAFDKRGRRIAKEKLLIGGEWYCFDAKGRMIKDRVVLLSKKRYYFTRKGTMARAKARPDLRKIGKYSYAVLMSGELASDQKLWIAGSWYCFDDRGRLAKQKMITVKNRTYATDRFGRVMKDKMVRIGEERYYFGENGELFRGRRFLWRNQIWFCDVKGRVIAKREISHFNHFAGI